MKKAKLLAGLLSVSLASAVVAGCGAAKETAGEATAGATTTPKAFQVSYPLQDAANKKLTFWLPIQAAAAKYISNYKDQEIFQEVAKKTGITVEFIHPAVGQEREQLGVLLASGSLPDMLQIRGLYEGGSPSGVEDGIFLDMTKKIPTFAPDYYKAISKSENAYRLATTNDGKITEFNILKQSAPAFTRMNFRDDILRDLGIAEVPVTLADYENAFEKMKAKGMNGYAPNMTGRNDQFMWPYGITEGFYIGDDGKVKWGQSEAAYKDYLTMMNKWWKAGYLYKDFMSNMSITDRRALWTGKKVGMHNEPIDLANSLAIANKFTVLPATYPRKTAGQPVHFETVSWETLPITTPGESLATVVSKGCKNPEIAMQYLNYFYTQDGADLANWGIKDKSYTVDANGKKTFTDYMLKNGKVPLADVQTMFKIHIFTKLAEPDVVCNPNVVSNPEGLALRNKYSDDKTVDNKQVLPAFQLTPKKSAERNTIMRDINTYADEMTLKFIVGTAPLSDFDKYLAQLKAMKIEDAIKITQEGYDLYKNKPGKP